MNKLDKTSKFLPVSCLVLLLGGCGLMESAEERYDATCRSYGHKKNTPAYNQCVSQESRLASLEWETWENANNARWEKVRQDNLERSKRIWGD